LLPLEVLDKFIGNRVCVLMKGDKEFFGTIRGFDEYVNLVLDNVRLVSFPDGKKQVVEVESMLLNGNHISMIVPGPDEENM